MLKVVSLVVPVHNEMQNVLQFVERIDFVFTGLYYNYNIIFVDDGSTDKTLGLIKKIAKSNSNVYFISLSRNFGQQSALRAGMEHAAGDCIITMDGDLQHPPEMIANMLEKWEQGFEIVYTIREENKKLGYFKNKSSRLFHFIMNRLSDLEMNYGEADFRLIGRRVLDIINSLPEHNLYYRGIVKWVGFSQIGLKYIPNERNAGESKYNLSKLIKLAIDGITAFSIKPLTIATYLGLIISVLSILYVPYILYSLFNRHPISGWTSLMFSLAFFGGLILFMLGIIGIYLGKLFMQSKGRPSYIIKEKHIQCQEQYS
jgi:glycosyltransferase involved in cell wall biosynthesis